MKQIWFEGLQRLCAIKIKGDAVYVASQHNDGVTAVTRRSNCNQKYVPQIYWSSSNTYFVVSLYTNLALNIINTNRIFTPQNPQGTYSSASATSLSSALKLSTRKSLRTFAAFLLFHSVGKLYLSISSLLFLFRAPVKKFLK